VFCLGQSEPWKATSTFTLVTELPQTTCAAQFGDEEMLYEHIKVRSGTAASSGRASRSASAEAVPIHVHRRPFAFGRVSRGHVALVTYNWRASRLNELRASLLALRRWVVRRTAALDSILHQKLGVFHVHGPSPTAPPLVGQAIALSARAAILPSSAANTRPTTPVPMAAAAAAAATTAAAAAAMATSGSSSIIVGEHGFSDMSSSNASATSATTATAIATTTSMAGNEQSQVLSPRRDTNESERSSSPAMMGGDENRRRTSTSVARVEQRPRIATAAAFAPLVRRTAPPLGWHEAGDADDGVRDSERASKLGIDGDALVDKKASPIGIKSASSGGSSASSGGGGLGGGVGGGSGGGGGGAAAGAMLAMRRAGSGASMVAAAMAARRRGMTLQDTIRRADDSAEPSSSDADPSSSSPATPTNASATASSAATAATTTNASVRGLAGISFNTLLACDELRGVPAGVCQLIVTLQPHPPHSFRATTENATIDVA
jgi:uncharacterized membrane protein YgcG